MLQKASQLIDKLGGLRAPDNFARNGQLRALMAQVCQEEASRMCLCQLCCIVVGQHVVLLQQLLGDLQDFEVKGKPGVLADDTKDLRVSQAAAGTPNSCCSTRWQERPAVFEMQLHSSQMAYNAICLPSDSKHTCRSHAA